jgi:hypothetical protein
MAIRFLNKSTIAQGLPRSSKVWDQLAVLSVPIEYLVVAGGGGGGIGVSNQYHGGGGGAGGLLSGTFTMQPSTSYTITIGAGGIANSSSGVNSVFNTVTCIGGGAGGINGGAGYSGGSGGGGSQNSGGGTGTAGPPRQGYNGAGGSQLVGGGGGGAGSGGQSYPPAAGGAGLASTIAGSSITYAAGGTGGVGASTAGAANSGTGGNGGAPGNNGGNGGSGIVIIAYPNIYPNIPNIGAGLTYTLDTDTRAGYKVYKFTQGTGTVSV